MKKIIALSLFVLIFQSCNKPEVEQLPKAANSGARVDGNKPDEGEMILEKVSNPYEIKNMQKALKSLALKNNAAKLLKIEANYKYIRVLPKNKDEYNIVNGDSTMDVFEYPLDYKIVKKGNKYKDKTLVNSEFTWMYAAVPISKNLKNNLKTEIIDLLYLPEGNGRNDEYTKQYRNSDASQIGLLKELENESFLINGDGKYNTNKSAKSAKVSGWYSSGRIRVEDQVMSYNETTNTYIYNTPGWVPVPGCTVRGNRWFTTQTTVSNNDGTFFINHDWPNGSPVDMSIKWDRGEFDIRTGAYGQAITSNANQYGAWYPNITRAISGEHFLFAHAHRAAWYYYYNNTFGVDSPPSAILLNTKMHIGVKFGNQRSHYFQFNSVWLASEVVISMDTYETSEAVFSTTIHELTHATHWKFGMSYPAYCTNAGQAGRLAESWAQMVGWYITRQVYSPDPTSQFEYDSFQDIKLSDMNLAGNCLSIGPNGNGPWYTPLFIDLIDNHNQNSYISSYPVDQANGYSITDLQNFLKARPTNWYMYRDYLEANSSNPTESAAVLLFSDYDY